VNKLLWVGLGGFAGSVLRYLVSGWAQQASGTVSFPWERWPSTCSAARDRNALYLADTRGILHPEARLFLIVGLLGGFTTFSAFGNEP